MVVNCHLECPAKKLVLGSGKLEGDLICNIEDVLGLFAMLRGNQPVTRIHLKAGLITKDVLGNPYRIGSGLYETADRVSQSCPLI